MIPRTVLPVNQPPSNGIVKNSIKLRNNATAYLRRTPSATTDRTRWTFSAWMKRGKIGYSLPIFFSAGLYGTAYASYTICYIHSNNYIYLDSGQYGVASDWTYGANASLVDTAAHFHLQIAFDSTQAVAANRLIIYINGVAAPYSSGSYPSLNYPSVMNISGYEAGVGGCNGAFTFDGVMSDVYYIDGQALAPASFGTTEAGTGMWSPKKYLGTYGTNGFHLEFKDTSALTTSSNVGLGKDTSGNGNYLITTNISTSDASWDVPYPIDARTANYCTLNALYPGLANPPLAGATAVSAASGFGTMSVPVGKWYFESTAAAGITDAAMGVGPHQYRSDGTRYNGASWVAYGSAYTSEVIGCEVDLINATIEFFKGGVSQGKITGLTFPAVRYPYIYASSGYYNVVNFGASAWARVPTSGFLALNTYNFPSPSIPKPNKLFDAILYTGNGATQSIVTPGGFAPDLLIYKGRSVAYNWGVFDTYRGATKFMSANLYDAEVTYSDTVTAFNANGWSLGANNNPNASATTYVGYAWKAGGAGVANSNGSIISTVSANAAAGVSVVSYIGTGANATVGHGLGVAPGLVIVKARGGATSWQVLHNAMTPDSIMYLEQQSAASADATKWNNTAPTSSVFSVGSSVGTNGSGVSFIVYCFTAIPGYSAIGSYVGNSLADGPITTLDFKPRFLLIKNKSRISNWLVFDTARSPFNVSSQQELDANLNNVEAASPYFDILSNGFKCRDAGGGATNYSGDIYTYFAIAESPFKYSLAR